MVMYLVRKTLSWTLVVFLATNLTFFLASSFLDPRSNYQGRRPPLTPEQITSLLEPYNLNPETPILERWWTWLTNILLHWDWGKTPVGLSVNEQISFRMWSSVQLLTAATIISIGALAGLTTVVMVLHDLNLAAQFCDRVHILNGGRVVCSGTPRDVFTADVIRRWFAIGAHIVTHPTLGVPQIIFDENPREKP